MHSFPKICGFCERACFSFFEKGSCAPTMMVDLGDRFRREDDFFTRVRHTFPLSLERESCFTPWPDIVRYRDRPLAFVCTREKINMTLFRKHSLRDTLGGLFVIFTSEWGGFVGIRWFCLSDRLLNFSTEG